MVLIGKGTKFKNQTKRGLKRTVVLLIAPLGTNKQKFSSERVIAQQGEAKGGMHHMLVSGSRKVQWRTRTLRGGSTGDVRREDGKDSSNTR